MNDTRFEPVSFFFGVLLGMLLFAMALLVVGRNDRGDGKFKAKAQVEPCTTIR